MGIRSYHIKGKTIGSGSALICAPLVGSVAESILGETEMLRSSAPDLIEWRADYFEKVECAQSVLDILKGIQANLGEIPLILTLRSFSEGGFRRLSQALRQEIITQAINSGLVDLVDIELSNDDRFISEIREITRRHGVGLIISSHEFQLTPPSDELESKLLRCQNHGADVAKLAVMPTSEMDVIRLMEVIRRFVDGQGEIPVIGISMGGLGVITRFAGSLFGSSVTFCSGSSQSAPGQMTMNDLQPLIRMLESTARDHQ